MTLTIHSDELPSELPAVSASVSALVAQYFFTLLSTQYYNLSYKGCVMSTDDPAAAGRRRFIAGMGALVGSATLPDAQTRPAIPAKAHRGALTPNEMQWLITAVGRLIPADASSGGAVEAHAHIYIDRALSGAYAKDLPAYRSGLAALQALARNEGAHHARDLAPAPLDAILMRMETGSVSEIDLAGGGAAFFRLLLRHTLEGTFGDPIHGGNHNFTGWKLIGYPGLQLFYSEAEQALDAPKAKKNRSVSDFGAKSDA
jgi:gluconate 2-dehydrogenase gamma chain